MIEAMIVSVALDDSHSVGINFETFQKSKTLRLVSGTPMANLGQISLSRGGLQFGVLDGNVGAFIDALEGIGDTNVIAAPHLLCLNKQKAEILIDIDLDLTVIRIGIARRTRHRRGRNET